MNGDRAVKYAEVEWGNDWLYAQRRVMAQDTASPTMPVALFGPRFKKAAIPTSVLSGKSPNGQG